MQRERPRDGLLLEAICPVTGAVGIVRLHGRCLLASNNGATISGMAQGRKQAHSSHREQSARRDAAGRCHADEGDGDQSKTRGSCFGGCMRMAMQSRKRTRSEGGGGGGLLSQLQLYRFNDEVGSCSLACACRAVDEVEAASGPVRVAPVQSSDFPVVTALVPCPGTRFFRARYEVPSNGWLQPSLQFRFRSGRLATRAKLFQLFSPLHDWGSLPPPTPSSRSHGRNRVLGLLH